jgi:Ca2+-binding RTX toxin-like protein
LNNWVLSGIGTISIDGDAEADTIDVQLTQLLLSGGTLHLHVNGSHGSDTLGAIVQFQPLSIGIFDGLVEGQDDDDSLLFNLVAPLSVLLVPSPLLDGGNGFDTGVATANVTIVNCEA